MRGATESESGDRSQSRPSVVCGALELASVCGRRELRADETGPGEDRGPIVFQIRIDQIYGLFRDPGIVNELFVLRSRV